MEEKLLIDLNDSVKRLSVGGPKDVTNTEADRELNLLLDLSSFLGGTSNTDCNATSSTQEKCVLNIESNDLMLQVRCSTNGISAKSSTENSFQMGFSPFGYSKANGTSKRNLDFILDSDPSKLMSPFGCPEKVKSHSLDSESNLENSVPIGELLQVQEEPKMPDDMFDIAVLEKKQFETLIDSDQLQGDNKSTLTLPSIPSIGSGESMFSSNSTINKGFLEVTSNTEQIDFFLSPNDSVFEEAQALAETFSKLATLGPPSPSEGFEGETSSIVSSCPDWDLSDCESMDVKTNRDELDNLLDLYSKENTENVIQEKIYRSERNSTSSLGLRNNLEAAPMNRIRAYSSSSSLSKSPPFLSTERLDNMKLKASEVIGAPLNFAPLKTNASIRSSAVPGRNGPLKAIVPLSQIVKSKMSSPVGIVPARGTPQLQVTEFSPDVLKPRRSLAGMISSTPKLAKPCNSSSLVSAVKKGLSRSMKRTSNSKMNPETTSTPSGPRTSGIGRVQEAGKLTGIARPATGGARKAFAPSPLPIKRYSNSTPSVKTNVARSSSTGHLPLTPSVKKVNGPANTYAFQSPLKRSNSLSTKLSTNSPVRSLLTASVNSPAKGNSTMNKLMSKFRRTSVSRGMKENVSPGKY